MSFQRSRIKTWTPILKSSFFPLHCGTTGPLGTAWFGDQKLNSRPLQTNAQLQTEFCDAQPYCEPVSPSLKWERYLHLTYRAVARIPHNSVFPCGVFSINSSFSVHGTWGRVKGGHEIRWIPLVDWGQKTQGLCPEFNPHPPFP